MRRLSRRQFFQVTGGLAFAGAAAHPAAGAEVADLKVRLEKDLQARTPEEFEFADRVVQLVHAGDLPVKLVDALYWWARPKRPYPFPFFQRGLKIEARKIGVVI